MPLLNTSLQLQPGSTWTEDTLRALGSTNPGIFLGSSGINKFLLLCRIHSHIHATSISEGAEPGMASPSVFETVKHPFS